MKTGHRGPTPFPAALFVALSIGLMPGDAHAQRFTDQTAQLDAAALLNGPASWGDYNNDGYVDLITVGRVWRNDGGTGFTRTFTLGGDGYSIWGDYNRDGYLDLVNWSGGVVSVFRNNAAASFTSVTLPALPMTETRGSAWGDFNRDGYIDLYVGGYEAMVSHGQPDAILSYNPATSFTKTWTEKKGQARSARGITACDFDQDGDLDVYVSNYREQQNYLWLNNGSGVFADSLAAYGLDVASPITYPYGPNGDGYTIGSAWADVNNDGYFDLFEGNLSHRPNPTIVQKPSAFYRNLGPSGNFHFAFMDTCGVSWQESYATPAFGDYDNDGDLDLYFTTVYNPATGGIPNYARLYRNDGNFHFTDVTSYEGLAGLDSTEQAAWADIDHDGDLDLATRGKIFVNGGPPSNWLEVSLVGSAIGGDVIGAQVKAITGSGTYTRQVEAGTGQANQNDMTLHFGLGIGPVTSVNLEVRWPDGTTSTASDVGPNSHIVIQKGQPGWSCGWRGNCVLPPPAQITDLDASETECILAYLSWTATGADDNTGTASAFDLRRAQFPINAGNFSSATPIAAPVPGPSGTVHETIAGGLTQCTNYYFAIRARDTAGNWSPITSVGPSQTQCCGGGFPAAGVSAQSSGTRLELLGAAPNPAVRGGMVQYSVPQTLAGQTIDLALYDVRGRRVRTIEHGVAAFGRTARSLDLNGSGGARLSRGIYFLRLQVGREIETRRFAIVN